MFRCYSYIFIGERINMCLPDDGVTVTPKHVVDVRVNDQPDAQLRYYYYYYYYYYIIILYMFRATLCSS